MSLVPLRCLICVLATALGLASPAVAAGIPGTFDYYVLSLSWSPSYCGTPAGENDRMQCAAGRRYAFVVHGLWPQYRKGWPQSCNTNEHWVPEERISAMLDIMPSKKLVIHEWQKHGTCSGLSMAEYFTTLRAWFEKLRIPARYVSPTAEVATSPQQLELDFIKSNKGLNASMLAVECGNRRDKARLSELRICFSRDGRFIPCGPNEARSCQAETLVLPPIR